MIENEVPGSTIEIDEIKLRREKLKQIDEAVKIYTKQVELSDAIKALKENENYIKVIETAYFDEESKRIAGALTEPTMLKRDQIENMMEMMSAIRILKTFLMFRENDGETAKAHLEDLAQYRIDALNDQE